MSTLFHSSEHLFSFTQHSSLGLLCLPPQASGFIDDQLFPNIFSGSTNRTTQLHLDCHRDTSNSPCQSEFIIFVSRPALPIFHIFTMIPSILLSKPENPWPLLTLQCLHLTDDHFLSFYDFYLLNLLIPLHPHYHCGCLYFVTSVTASCFPCLQSYPISSHS